MRLLGGEPFAVEGAPASADREHAGGVRGREVVVGIADIGDLFGGDVELAGGQEQRLWVRLGLLDFFGADEGLEIVGQAANLDAVTGEERAL